MQTEDFIKEISSQRNVTFQGLIDIYTNPPGRKPRESLKNISVWYNSLGQSEKEVFKSVVKDVLDAGIFQLLCILDHVSFLEDSEEKTKFELYAIKGDERVLINDSSKEDLHNIYNSLIREDWKEKTPKNIYCLNAIAAVVMGALISLSWFCMFCPKVETWALEQELSQASRLLDHAETFVPRS